MNYTREKFTDAEATAIMAEARANIVRAENLQQRVGGGRFVTKTLDHARVPAPEPAPAQQMDAHTASWVEWVDERIEEKFNVVLDVVGQALGELLDKQHENLQTALDRRDHAIQALRDEVEIKIGLGRKLAKLKAELEQARQQAPNFKSELDDLRKEVARQEKTIVRLRGEQSQLAYAQQQLDAEQQKNRQQVTLTAVQLTAIGGQTREVLERLREGGVDFIEEWSPSGLAS